MNTSFERILVILDHQDTDAIAFRRAIRLAKANGGKVNILVDWHDPLRGKEHSALADDLLSSIQEMQSLLQQLVDKFEAHAHLGEQQVLWKTPLEKSLQGYLASHEVDLIMKAGEHKPGIGNWLMGKQERYLIHDCPVPTWILKPRAWDQDIQVLIALDMEDEGGANQYMNQKIIRTGSRMAEFFGGELHLVDCYFGEIGTMTFEYDSQTGFKRDASIKEQHIAKLQALMDNHEVLDVSIHLEQGIPDDAIPDKAKELAAELVVIGNNQDSGVLDKLFGDTAKVLVQSMPCDLLVLKPTAKS